MMRGVKSGTDLPEDLKPTFMPSAANDGFEPIPKAPEEL